MHWLTNISCPTSLSFYTPLRLLKFFIKNETIATPFSNLRLISFASTIVRQSEISTDKAIPESKLMFTWAKYNAPIPFLPPPLLPLPNPNYAPTTLPPPPLVPLPTPYHAPTSPPPLPLLPLPTPNHACIPLPPRR